MLGICLVFTCALKSSAAYHPPKETGYVNDFARIISSENYIKLDRLIKELKLKTGAELVVVTLKSLDGYPIEDVGLAIGREWGVGQKGKDNGLVIVVAPNDRKVRIEVGYGLEGAIPDSAAGRIRDGYMIPYFKQGDYNQGIFYGTQAVAQAIAKEYGVTLEGNVNLPEPQQTDSGDDLFSWIIFIIVIILFIRYPSFMIGFFLGGGRISGSGGSSSGGGFGGFGGGGFGGGGSSGGW